MLSITIESKHQVSLGKMRIKNFLTFVVHNKIIIMIWISNAINLITYTKYPLNKNKRIPADNDMITSRLINHNLKESQEAKWSKQTTTQRYEKWNSYDEFSKTVSKTRWQHIKRALGYFHSAHALVKRKSVTYLRNLLVSYH